MKTIIKKYWYLIALVIIIPILLNYTLPLSFVGNIIGGDNSTEVWLNFFSSYFGSVISTVVAFYVLYKNRNDNFNIIKYQNEYSNLQDRIKELISYINIYNFNNIKLIYNDWRLEKKETEELKKEIKILMDNAFISFETFSLNYPKRYFNEKPFFIKQKNNYSSLILFLQDFQVILNFDAKQWNNIELFKIFLMENEEVYIDNISIEFLQAIKDNKTNKFSIFQLLLDTYQHLNLKIIESQVRDFIETEYSQLDKKYLNISK